MAYDEMGLKSLKNLRKCNKILLAHVKTNALLDCVAAVTKSKAQAIRTQRLNKS